MPMQRRCPKRGFKNPQRVEYQVVNVGRLAGLGGRHRGPRRGWSRQRIVRRPAGRSSCWPAATLKVAPHGAGGRGERGRACKVEAAGGTVGAEAEAPEVEAKPEGPCSRSSSNIFQVPELKRRILFTLGLFVVYRLGEHVPDAGRERGGAAGASTQPGAGRCSASTTCSSAGRSRAPRSSRSASCRTSPPRSSCSCSARWCRTSRSCARRAKKARRRSPSTRATARCSSRSIQSFAYGVFLQSMSAVAGPGGRAGPGLRVPADRPMITQTTGTIFVMWLGEQITERGIGNGISLIIFISIVGRAAERDHGTTVAVAPGRHAEPVRVLAVIAWRSWWSSSRRWSS